MKKTAFVFAGQGAQYVGMGKDFYDRYEESREVFDRAALVAPYDIRSLCFDGPQEELTKTRVCQGAVFTVSYAIYRALRINSPYVPAAVAGLSLGEYTAIVAAGCLDFDRGLRLVNARAQFMTEACAINPGTMVSVLGESLEKVKPLCEETGVQVANINSSKQIVVAGSREAIAAFTARAKEQGVRKIIALQVEGAFHSRAMTPAKEKLAAFLADYAIKDAHVPVYCNVDPKATLRGEEIKKNLITQVDGATYWHDTILAMHRDGIEMFVEIGPGKVLSGLIAKTLENPCVYNIATAEDLRRVHEALQKA
jgi:[acyl-carrier-protein] S-malonyltransferase